MVLLTLRKFPRDRNTLSKLLVFSLINVLSFPPTLLGLVNEESGIASVLAYTYPLFVFGLAIPFLKERVSSCRVLGVMTGFVGVVILSFEALGSFMLGAIGMLILGSFLWAAANVYYKKYLSQTDPLTANFLSLLVGAILLSVFGAITGDYPFPINVTYIVMILYASVVTLSVAETIWFGLLRSEDATVLAGSSFLVPLAALFFGWKLLAEGINVESVLGSALVLVGVYLVNVK